MEFLHNYQKVSFDLCIVNELSKTNPEKLIKDAESLSLAKEESAGSFFMIGRGCLGRPWIFEELITGEKPKFNMQQLVQTHLDALLNYYGKKGIFIARKHLAWYAKGKTGMADFCREVFKESNPNKVSKMVADFF